MYRNGKLTTENVKSSGLCVQLIERVLSPSYQRSFTDVEMLVYFLFGSALLAACYGQSRETVLTNTAGYKMERAPTYIVTAPKRIRPNQVIQVFVTILKMEYPNINVRVAIVKNNVEYAGSELPFKQPSSRILQLKMPQNAPEGKYRLRVEGRIVVNGNVGGDIFRNETDVDFHPKYVSLFIQLSKPIYRQGQTVFFRVVPISPNLMPEYGSMTVYVRDPTGFAVRRWLAVQTNAGGILSKSFSLADQPNYGNWSITVDAFGFTYSKHFLVEEYWDPRFDVNVTVPPYVMDNEYSVGGVFMANITTGKPVEGNATVVLTVFPPVRDLRYPNDELENTNLAYENPITIYQDYSYVKGPVFFNFTMSDILTTVQEKWPGFTYWTSLMNFELQFNVSVYDWFFQMTKQGRASTIVFSSKTMLRWIGDKVRTFKPNTNLNVHVAVMRDDGTPVTSPYQNVTLYVDPRYSSGGSGYSIPSYSKTPQDGIVQFCVPVDEHMISMNLRAIFDEDSSTAITMVTHRFYSPSNSFIVLTTSTENPRVNEYMILHVKTSNYVPRVYYQVVAGGNIIMADELEMVSRRKSFAIAMAQEMVPTARVVVYYISGQPEEIVIDTLTFFVDGLKSNSVTAKVNRGKDFTRDTIEMMATAEPGSYVAFGAIPLDLYSRGLNDGLTEYNLIDELNTYDSPAVGSYQHLWRLSETEYEYKFFIASGYGIDSNTTFQDSGLIVLSDVTVTRVPNDCDKQENMLPCFDGTCYHMNKSCDGFIDCTNDWADERNCPTEDPRYNNRTMHMINRVSRILRFYEDSSWAWKERFVKPDGEIDFRVDVPKYPLTWVLNGISLSRTKGFGLMSTPIKYDASRFMYINVESPSIIIRGEQIGVRVTVFNYWFYDDFIEVLVTMKGSPDYNFVLVEDEGYVTSYNPKVHSGDHQTIVFLEPGQSKDILMPIVPTMVLGNFTYTVTAWCFMEQDSVTKQVFVQADGVMNYYHTPYLIDMITYGTIGAIFLKVNLTDQFVVPDQRYHTFVPGSPRARVTLFGDVVTPGFFVDYPTAEDIMYRPYGAGEMNMFNFAYNLLTLKFKKANKQLPLDVLNRTIGYMNTALQRQLSYMKEDGSFKMFRDDNTSSIWLTAFVAKTLHDANFGEWEKQLFVPQELINKIVVWICSKQNNQTGEFYDRETPIYDRKYSSLNDMKFRKMTGHPVPLTAYVLIALTKITDTYGEAQSCIEKARKRASDYLFRHAYNISQNGEIFHHAITTYALTLGQQRSSDLFYSLWDRRRKGEEIYFADDTVRENPSDLANNLRRYWPRIELVNDAYAVQSTAYALMSHINIYGTSLDFERLNRNSMMRWLQSMRNYFGGFASSQDTLVAMESLIAFTQVDPNRNVFDMYTELNPSANTSFKSTLRMIKTNYTTMQSRYMPQVYGQVQCATKGQGRAMLQLTTTYNVELPIQIKNTQDSLQFYLLDLDFLKFTGRNASTMAMRTCVTWIYTERSLTSGLSVLEIDLPTGYIVMNSTLRELVQSDTVKNLKRAEFYYRKIVFYFDYIDSSKTCVEFRAHRWYPVANMTIQHRMRVFDYYEPGLHNTTMYNTYGLFSLNICYVCGSYQCPYCPFFNVAAIIKASFTLLSLVLGFVVTKYLLRVT